jgi:thioredoxin 2
MAEVVPCPSCQRKNRVPATSTGKPRCAVCRADLPWLVDADDDSFDSAVSASVPVVVDLWAPWCAPCRMVAPVLEALARDRAGRIKVVKVDVDRSPAVAARYSAHSIPTLLLFDRGRLADRRAGALSAVALRDWLDANLPAG